MTINEKLRLFSATHKMTVISTQAGLSPSAMHRYISQGTSPNCSVALRIAKALHVSVVWLIDDDQDWPPVWVDRQIGSAQIQQTTNAAKRELVPVVAAGTCGPPGRISAERESAPGSFSER